MDNTHKKDFSTAKKHHNDFWDKTGFVVNIGVPNPNSSYTLNDNEFKEIHFNAELCAQKAVSAIENTLYFGDSLPIAFADYGTVTLASILGATPSYENGTVWYEPCINAENYDLPIVFNEKNRQWQTHLKIFEAIKAQNIANCIISCLGYSPGMDTLAALRGTEELLMDMLDNPIWVHKKLKEINTAYGQAFEKTAQALESNINGMGFGYFGIWGEGKTTQLQCDIAATISPGMYSEFVVPYLAQQCTMLDRSLYHVDGTQALCHMDALLSIKELTAVEWTPQAGIEEGGNERWYPLYKQILAAEKAVQIIGVKPQEIEPILHTLGTKGVYISTYASNIAQAKEIEKMIEKFR